MRFTYSDIKDQVLTEIREYNLTEERYPEDRLSELAESACPIYTGEVVTEWAELPSEYSDAWQDLGTDGSGGIVTLMQVDLFLYYEQQFRKAYQELLQDLEEEEA
jgi:hypothetical protein